MKRQALDTLTSVRNLATGTGPTNHISQPSSARAMLETRTLARLLARPGIVRRLVLTDIVCTIVDPNEARRLARAARKQGFDEMAEMFEARYSTLYIRRNPNAR